MFTSHPASTKEYIITECLKEVSATICQMVLQWSSNYSCEERAAVSAPQTPVPPCLILHYIHITFENVMFYRETRIKYRIEIEDWQDRKRISYPVIREIHYSRY